MDGLGKGGNESGSDEEAPLDVSLAQGREDAMRKQKDTAMHVRRLVVNPI